MSRAARDAPVVVTGGAGAIGGLLVRSLVEDGRSVRVVDNLSSGRREHLAGLLDDPRLALTVADLRHAAEFSGVFEGAAAVWHLAANPDIRRGTSDPNLDFEHGTLATFHVLEGARKADVPKFLFSSSSVVYGLPSVFPTPEDYGPLLPQSLYGASKLASEGMVSAYCHCYGITGYLFRFANIVGPGMTHGVIYDFFEKLDRTPEHLEVLGDGHQSKSYLRTEDCVAAMRLIEEAASARVNVVNLGTRDRTSVREIAERVVRAMGGRARIEYTGGTQGWPGDIPQQLLSIDKALGLGWRPRFSSAEAVERTIEEQARLRPVARAG